MKTGFVIVPLKLKHMVAKVNPWKYVKQQFFASWGILSVTRACQTTMYIQKHKKIARQWWQASKNIFAKACPRSQSIQKPKLPACRRSQSSNNRKLYPADAHKVARNEKLYPADAHKVARNKVRKLKKARPRGLWFSKLGSFMRFETCSNGRGGVWGHLMGMALPFIT